MAKIVLVINEHPNEALAIKHHRAIKKRLEELGHSVEVYKQPFEDSFLADLKQRAAGKHSGFFDETRKEEMIERLRALHPQAHIVRLHNEPLGKLPADINRIAIGPFVRHGESREEPFVSVDSEPLPANPGRPRLQEILVEIPSPFKPYPSHWQAREKKTPSHDMRWYEQNVADLKKAETLGLTSPAIARQIAGHLHKLIEEKEGK